MIFTETKLKEAYLIELDLLKDNRGYFARSFCKKEFENAGLITDFVQQNVSYNFKKGTLRGMHYQQTPYEEVKIVKCVRGSIYDVIVDVREDSDTYFKWFGCELTQENEKMLYIPKGFAHGYQTLEDNSEIMYMVSQYYTKESEKIISYNNKDIGITWPIKENIIISEKDSKK